MNSRIRSICAKLKGHGLDSLVLFSPANISYLTGYRSRDSYLVVSKKGSLYITDSRYTEEARVRLKGLLRVRQIKDSFSKTLASTCSEFGFKRLGFEERYLSFADYRKISRGLGKGTKFVPVWGLVEDPRRIKGADELKKIRKATSIAVAALRFAAKLIARGRREVEIAAEIERFIRYNGASMGSFDLIVASGANSAFVHHLTSGRKLGSNEPLLIDMGVDYYGYKSDLTRVFFSGKITLLIRRVYNIVREAQARAISKIRPGIKVKEIDAAAREYIAAEGYGSFFGHNLGHGVGLEVHEAPAISPKSEQELKAGMVITIEPGIYLPGKFGIRIEDMVLVTRDGCEILSQGLDK